jgi:4-hydroxy-tetrahydrodipicolinate reductase
LLQKEEVQLCWVVRCSKRLGNRSIAEFLGVEGVNSEGLIFSKDEWTAEKLFNQHPVDVVLDFSSADGVLFYGEEAGKQEVAIISAISEYSRERIDFLKKIADVTRVVWSPNITIGINFLMLAAKVLKNIAPYTDIEIIEEHFKDKKETSGTAKKIAQALDIEESAIKTIRAGGIVGHHEILFGFPYQTVRLTHDSISREAFGNGAWFAATHVMDKEKGFYTMENLLTPYFSYSSLIE